MIYKSETVEALRTPQPNPDGENLGKAPYLRKPQSTLLLVCLGIYGAWQSMRLLRLIWIQNLVRG